MAKNLKKSAKCLLLTEIDFPSKLEFGSKTRSTVERNQIEIKLLLKSDIQHITHLQPDGWNDIRKVFYQFIDYDFFYPVKAIFQDKIIGVGEVIFNQDSAWIGNIIVDKAFRKKGIGTFITEYLSKEILKKNISSQLVLATPIGHPVYDKLGFKYVSDYVFLKREDRKKREWTTESRYIVDFDPRYFDEMTALDKLAMGEDKSEVLQHFTEDALLFIDQELKGFYLPKLGDGLIIAKNHEAGFELLKIKWATKSELITLPKENTEIIDFAKSHGFKPYRYAFRMILGKNFDWNPQMIYNRVGGYLG